jgi:hypothetical protein
MGERGGIWGSDELCRSHELCDREQVDHIALAVIKNAAKQVARVLNFYAP